MDQMRNVGKSVQIESIGTTCLGIVLLQQQEYTLLLLISYPIYCDARNTLALKVV